MSKINNDRFDHELITDKTERVDAILSVNEIKKDVDNVVLYGEMSPEYADSLKKQIKLHVVL